MTPRRSASSSPRSSPTARRCVSSPPPEPSASGDLGRDRLAAVLGEHYAAGRLTVSELDRRLERVLAAESVGEAATALDGLPPIAGTGSGRRGGRRRHGEHRAAQPGWLPTLERFRDPSSGRLMRVWVDPADASRHYVAEATP